MRQKIKIVLFLIFISHFGFAQNIKKSSFMVMPSTQWMTAHNYTTTIDNQGESVEVYNYKKAMSQDIDLLPVIAKIEGILKGRGLQTINLQAKLSDLDQESAEDAMQTGKATSSESAYDKLVKRAKADYLVYMTWNITKQGPNSFVTFTMEAIDAYTNEKASSVSGTGNGSFDAILPIILEEAVLTHLDQFLAGVSEHAEDILANGRKVKIKIKKSTSWAGDLEKEYNGKELNVIIEDWMKENTVNGVDGLDDTTENFMQFNNTRIPLLGTDGKRMDAKSFIQPLVKMLKEAPFSIPTKIQSKGAGKVEIILGGK